MAEIREEEIPRSAYGKFKGVEWGHIARKYLFLLSYG
jgi:hypothetical protein